MLAADLAGDRAVYAGRDAGKPWLRWIILLTQLTALTQGLTACGSELLLYFLPANSSLRRESKYRRYSLYSILIVCPLLECCVGITCRMRCWLLPSLL